MSSASIFVWRFNGWTYLLKFELEEDIDLYSHEQQDLLP